jgi:hypothetical protein
VTVDISVSTHPLIPANRFITRSTNRTAWLTARQHGVTATQVRDAATPSGFKQVLEDRRHPHDIIPNEAMEFGNEQEPHLLRYAHDVEGILPSDWLIAADGNPSHMATPDGLSPDHRLIAEAKTTGADWVTIPIGYRRQVQFQLYVTGAERCLFLWQQRIPDGHGWFFPAWIEPRTVWFDRDEDMILDLVSVADRLLEN